MTRFPAAVTDGKGSGLVRLADGLTEELVVTMTDRTVELRPKRSRSPDSVVLLTWSSIYQRGLMALAEERRRAKGKK